MTAKISSRSNNSLHSDVFRALQSWCLGCASGSSPAGERWLARVCCTTQTSAQFLWILSKIPWVRMTEGVRWLFYLWWDGYKCVSRLQPGRQPPQLPALLSYSDCRNHTLISGFLPGALNSSFSAPNTKWLFAFISQTIALALPRFYPVWLFLTLWKLQWWRMLQQFSVLFLFPAVPISLLNSIMNEFTGAFLLLSFSCLKGAVFWSMRQMIEKQGELKFTFFSPCLAEYD